MDGTPLEHLFQADAEADGPHPWRLSFLVRPLGVGGLRCALFDMPGRTHRVIVDFNLCLKPAASARPPEGDGVHLLDASVVPDRDGRFHCTVTAALPCRTITVSLSPYRGGNLLYPGDAAFGMTVGHLTLNRNSPHAPAIPASAVAEAGRSQYFVLCSQGNAGSIWLAEALNLHPDISCSMGIDHPVVSMNEHHPFTALSDVELDDLRTNWRPRIAGADDVPFGVFDPKARQFVQDILAEKGIDHPVPARRIPLRHDLTFEELKRFFPAPVIGNVHGLTIHTFTAMQGNGESLRSPVAVNLIRHPISRFQAFIGRQIDGMALDATLDTAKEAAFHELRAVADDIAARYGVDWQDARNRHTLWALKGLDYFWLWTRELVDFPEITHVPMERVMSDADYFRSLLTMLTGSNMANDQAYLGTVFSERRRQNGRVHPTGRGKPAPSPAEAFAGWPLWLQDMVRREVETHDIARLHAPFGYDFSFMT